MGRGRRGKGDRANIRFSLFELISEERMEDRVIFPVAGNKSCLSNREDWAGIFE